MLTEFFASTVNTLRRVGPLRTTVRYVKRIPVLRNVVASAFEGIFSIHGERVWKETPIGWMKFEPAWEGSLAEGEPEPETLPALATHLHSETVFYDIGAHIGFYALLASRQVRQVFAFEPDPDNSAVIEEVIARNKLANVTVVEGAVSDTQGQLDFERSPGLRISGHIAEVGCDSSDTGDRITVPSFSLDQFCESHPVPTFIKVDVEGAEGAVLRGARNILKSHPTLLVEVHREEYLAEVEGLLTGYKITRLHRSDLPPFPAHYLAEWSV